MENRDHRPPLGFRPVCYSLYLTFVGQLIVNSIERGLVTLVASDRHFTLFLQMASALASRAVGAIVGSAVADAAGNSTEVDSFPSFPTDKW